MATYDFSCVKCNKPFELFLSFSDFDKSKSSVDNDVFIVDCPYCGEMKAKIVYEEVPHSHVINTNNVGVHMERNAKVVGKSKIEEQFEKKKEALAPKAKSGWFGKLPKDKHSEIINSRKSVKERQKAAEKYILTGE